MTQITEDYVSFEIAKLLKEKGFNEGCRQYWYRGNLIFSRSEIWNRELDNYEDEGWTAPTLQMAMKWLREVHKIFISIQQHMDMSYVWYIYKDGAPKGCDRESHNNTYEQACEAAIKYCLENLI